MEKKCIYIYKQFLFRYDFKMRQYMCMCGIHVYSCVRVRECTIYIFTMHLYTVHEFSFCPSQTKLYLYTEVLGCARQGYCFFTFISFYAYTRKYIISIHTITINIQRQQKAYYYKSNISQFLAYPGRASRRGDTEDIKITAENIILYYYIEFRVRQEQY